MDVEPELQLRAWVGQHHVVGPAPAEGGLANQGRVGEILREPVSASPVGPDHSEERRTLDPKLSHAVPERIGMEAEELRSPVRSLDAPRASLEKALDVSSFDVLQLSAVALGLARGNQCRIGEVFAQPKRVAGRVDHGTLDHVPQLSYV